MPYTLWVYQPPSLEEHGDAIDLRCLQFIAFGVGLLLVHVCAAMLGLALAATCARLGPLSVCARGRYLCALGAAICVRLGPLSVCIWGAICARLGPLSVCVWGRYLCAVGAAIFVRRFWCEVSGCQVYCNGVDVS